MLREPAYADNLDICKDSDVRGRACWPGVILEASGVAVGHSGASIFNQRLARISIFILTGIDRLMYVLNYEETQLKDPKGAWLRLWDYIVSTTYQILQM